MMTNDFEKQLDSIRTELYQQTVGMSNSEIAAATNANAQKIAEQFNIKIIKKASISPVRKIV